jgi:hypothetical protein
MVLLNRNACRGPVGAGWTQAGARDEQISIPHRAPGRGAAASAMKDSPFDLRRITMLTMRMALTRRRWSATLSELY